jgi:hypothetical protein
VASRRRKNKTHAPVHQTQHHRPHARGRGGTTPGGRQRASRRLYSVRTPRGWLEPARGEFLAPNSPLGPPPVLLVDFFSVGWCPSKRVVVIHYSRPYNAQKVSGGCVRAISGNRSCLRRMYSLSQDGREDDQEGKAA